MGNAPDEANDEGTAQEVLQSLSAKESWMTRIASCAQVELMSLANVSSSSTDLIIGAGFRPDTIDSIQATLRFSRIPHQVQ